MVYNLKIIFFKINVIIILVSVLLQIFAYGQVYSFHDVTDTDRFGSGSHSFRVPDAGDAVRVPQEFAQSTDDVEGYNQNWTSGTKEAKVYNVWSSQGKKASDSHWAYIEFSGEPRYLVALAPTFGLAGDFVDIYITNNGKETIYPCIIGDSKDIWVDSAFVYEGTAYGHVGSNGSCKIIEVCTEIAATSQSVSALSPLLNKLKNITQIANGGSMFEHPDGPVGLDGSYTYEDGTSSDSNSSGYSDGEYESFIGAVGAFLRTKWSSLSSFLDNHVENRNDVTVLYDFKNKTSSNTSMGNKNILEACAAVTKMMIDRGCVYPSDYDLLDRSGIDYQLNEAHYICCATYVSSVLYYSGLLSAEQINAYNYHYTGSGGVPDMLAAAGWKKLENPSDMQPGDVLNDYGTHVMIYAGNGKVWDESTAVTSISGRAPFGTPIGYSQMNSPNMQVWRKQ